MHKVLLPLIMVVGIAIGVGEVIHGCVDNATGILRIVPNDTSCEANETHIEWGIVGIQGPQGEPGPQGPPGPQGETGIGDIGCSNGQVALWDDTTGQWQCATVEGGIPGPQGPTGPQGEPGPQGPSGPQGEQGPPGESGIGAIGCAVNQIARWDGSQWQCVEDFTTTELYQELALLLTRIAYYANDNIYSVKPDGTSILQLTDSGTHEERPAWSSDGRRIAFYSTRDGNMELYVMDANGSNQIRLTNNAAADSQPAWSPDGTKIAFSSDRDGAGEIYVMNEDGSEQLRLTTGGAGAPSWSRDGSKIAFVSRRDQEQGEIYTMNADGTNVTRLTFNSEFDGSPAWSPTEDKIAFVSRRSGISQIYMMNVDGTGQSRLTTEYSESPVWSPDGRKIAFLRNGIFVMNSDGTNQVIVLNDSFIQNMSWSVPLVP